MDRPQFLSKVVEWLRAGYPNGVPQQDHVPLFALLRRQLTPEEVERVSAELTADADWPAVISKIDAAVEITKIVDEMPHEDDIARVREFLRNAGWPFDDTPLPPPGGDAGAAEEDQP
ncbi:MAG: DUF3349 domain-containing protein [Gordonia sp. (in: high G+C Gram-positive bacteria)]